MPRNDNSSEEEWGKPILEPDDDLDLDTALAANHTAEATVSAQADWFTPPSPNPGPDQPAAGRRGRRLPPRGWAALAALAAVTAGVLAITHTGDEDSPHAARVSATAGPPATTTAASGPCAGLSGAVVTTRGGKTDTIAGIIATFEADYYTERSAAKAIQLVTPETGITEQGLADGIASIPTGTTHCVAITPLTTNTATAHLVELHPDGRRVDYLQVINTVPGPGGGLLISHIQEQG
ncbi:hypothetical protein [Nocardia mikamii]|uniref:hypothetical protein n=1 Tax=Nocardia mikamii TaxID=508464 RepID=UPI000A4B31BA|nr:hypothetical protein [Nocardia mikamii]